MGTPRAVIVDMWGDQRTVAHDNQEDVSVM